MGVTRGPSEGDVIRCEGLAERAVAPRGKKNAPEARASGAGMRSKRSGLLRQVLGAVGAQGVQQELGIRRGANRTVQHNLAGGDFLSVDAFVGVVVRANGGTGQRNSREEAAGARIGEHLRAQGYVGIRRGVSPNGACGNRGVAAELYFACENGVGTAIIHDENDEVRGLAAYLKSDAGAFEGHHGRGAPGTVETIAAAASHDAAAIA